MKLLPFTLALLFNSALSFANAQDWRTDVISHPFVTALVQLMNSKYASSCVAPKETDILSGCTGAIPPATEPYMINEPCYFNLTVKCDRGSAVISGERQLYVLVNPGHPQKTVDPVIVISDVKLQ
jgi:hypothetical protein